MKGMHASPLWVFHPTIAVFRTPIFFSCPFRGAIFLSLQLWFGSCPFRGVTGSVRINHTNCGLLNGDIQFVDSDKLTMPISWLFIDPSEHHYSKFTFF